MKLLVATKTLSLSKKGFTIVELMIALSVLSILLLLSVLTLMNLGKMFVKGNNEANVQNTTRNIISDLSSQLQLGGAIPDIVNLSHGYFCIGTTRYSYVVGKQVNSSPGTNQTRHALWRDTMTSSVCPPYVSGAYTGLDMTKVDPSTTPDGNGSVGSGSELIPVNMRLTKFSITPVSKQAGVYEIAIGVAYGDDDLLCVREVANDCNTSWISQNTNIHAQTLKDASSSQTVGCVGDTGQQFCSTSSLSVTVARRLSSE